MRALLCWIGVVLFAMLGLGGLLVGVSNLAWAPAVMGLSSLFASWASWALARRLSARQLASASDSAPSGPDDDDDDSSGSFASALLASSLPSRAGLPAAASLGPRAEAAFEPMECKADAPEGDDQIRGDDCSPGDSDVGSDSGSDTSSSD